LVSVEAFQGYNKFTEHISGNGNIMRTSCCVRVPCYQVVEFSYNSEGEYENVFIYLCIKAALIEMRDGTIARKMSAYPQNALSGVRDNTKLILAFA
jgi:hypothetical protein